MNLFAYTEPGGAVPAYLSINLRNEAIILTARTRDEATAEVELPHEQIPLMIAALRQEAPAAEIPGLNWKSDADNEAVDWITHNIWAIRRDNGDMEYRLPQVVKAYQAGKASAHAPAADGPKDGWRASFDFEKYLSRERQWSETVFGPGKRMRSLVDHIEKELREIEADPSDLEEWVDVMILAFDGAWREGYAPHQVIAAILAKQEKNERREWPDWRSIDLEKPIEHIRAPLPTKGGLEP